MAIPQNNISGIEQEMIWQTGVQLQGMTFSKKDEGWLLTVKVKDRQGKRKVSFVFAHTPEDCLDTVWTAMCSTAVTLKWREDKWGRG